MFGLTNIPGGSSQSVQTANGNETRAAGVYQISVTGLAFRPRAVWVYSGAGGTSGMMHAGALFFGDDGTRMSGRGVTGGTTGAVKGGVYDSTGSATDSGFTFGNIYGYGGTRIYWYALGW